MKRAALPLSKKKPKRRLKRRSSESIDMKALFQLVKQYKLLYVPEDPDYNLDEVKEAVWAHIAEQLECSVAYTKKRWKCARENYLRFLRSVALAKLARRNYTVWKYAKDIAFVRPYTKKVIIDNVTDSTDDELAYYGRRRKGLKYKPRKTSQPPQNKIDDLDEEDEHMDDSSDDDDDLDNNKANDSVENSGIQPTKSNVNETAEPPLESSNISVLELDDIDTIFIGYSRTIKKFSLKQQSLLKFKIAELIMKTETEHYR